MTAKVGEMGLATDGGFTPTTLSKIEQTPIELEASAWITGLFSLIPPAHLAAVEAFACIAEPISAPVLFEVLDRSVTARTAGHIVRRLADAGVLVEHHRGRRRNTFERFYVLAS